MAAVRKARTQKKRLQIVIDEEMEAAINAWRRKQECPQDISKTVRQLISLGAKAKAA
jgi:hypothetical protein